MFSFSSRLSMPGEAFPASNPWGIFIMITFSGDGTTVSEAGVPALPAGNAFRLYAEASGGFDTGAIGILENVWCMPDHKGYFPDERMEIIGDEGGVYLQETYPALSVVDKNGSYTPDPTYWPEIRPGVRGGALAEELNYFLTCITNKTPPTIITPEESMAAVQACLAAEVSAASGKVVSVQGFE